MLDSDPSQLNNRILRVVYQSSYHIDLEQVDGVVGVNIPDVAHHRTSPYYLTENLVVFLLSFLFQLFLIDKF